MVECKLHSPSLHRKWSRCCIRNCFWLCCGVSSRIVDVDDEDEGRMVGKNLSHLAKFGSRHIFSPLLDWQELSANTRH